MTRPGLVVCLVAALSPSLVADSQGGSLCRTTADCRRTDSNVFTVNAGDKPQAWFWTNQSGADVAVFVASGTESISPYSDRFRTVLLSVRAASPRIGSSAVVEWRNAAGPLGSVALSTRLISRMRALHLPREATRLRILAEHHRPGQIDLGEVVQDQPARLGIIELVPYPIISGRVVQAEDRTPLAGARIELEDRKHFVETDASGLFELEIPGEWPPAIVISQMGRGRRVVPIPPASADLSLGILPLAVAGRITVDPLPEPGSRAELWAAGENGKETLVTTALARPDESNTSFDEVAPGVYRLQLKGSGPLECYATAVTVAPGEETRIAAHVTPIDLRIEIRRGGRPVAGAEVFVTHFGDQWSAEVEADGMGIFESTLWQEGSYAAMVAPDAAGGTASTHLHPFEVRAPGPVHEIIALPSAKVTVAAVDAKSGHPVADCAMILEVFRDGERVGGMIRELGEGGVATLESLDAAEYVIRLNAPGYLHVEKRIVLAEDEQASVTIAMSRASVARVQVVDVAGAPIAGARIFIDPRKPDTAQTTDGRGVAVIPLERDSSREILVLPAEGSFAFATATAADNETTPPSRVVVPPGDAVIRLIARTVSDEPLASLSFLVRAGGRMLDPAVLELFFFERGNRFRTGEDGSMVLRNLPQGVYEFWPYFTSQEAEAILRGASAAAPVQIGAHAGENVVELNFRRSGE